MRSSVRSFEVPARRRGWFAERTFVNVGHPDKSRHCHVLPVHALSDAEEAALFAEKVRYDPMALEPRQDQLAARNLSAAAGQNPGPVTRLVRTGWNRA